MYVVNLVLCFIAVSVNYQCNTCKEYFSASLHKYLLRLSVFERKSYNSFLKTKILTLKYFSRFTMNTIPLRVFFFLKYPH